MSQLFHAPKNLIGLLTAVVVLLFFFPFLGEAQLFPYAHGVQSGFVTILDEKTLQIDHFSYDGTGPAAWFVVGRGSDYLRERVKLSDFTIIPDENGSCQRLKRYDSRSIQLTLPGQLTFRDIDYLAVYCLDFQHNFGYVAIPKNVQMNPATRVVGDCSMVERFYSLFGDSNSLYPATTTLVLQK